MEIPEKRTLENLETASYPEKILTAHSAIQDKQYKVAKTLIADLMTSDPEDVQAMSLWAELEMHKCNYGLAYRLLVDVYPRIPKDHPRLCCIEDCIGHCLIMLWRHEEGIPWLEKAIDSDPTRERHDPYVNLSMANLWLSNYDKAIEFAMRALDLKPGSPSAIDNLAVAQLAIGEWAQGWDNHEIGLGRKFRTEFSYGDEPRWDGEEGACVVVAPEQGLGDEIMFSAMISDLEKVSERVIVECDSRLEGLFKRSFPKCGVYGTRWDKQPVWNEEKTPDFRCSMPTLARFFRREQEQFNGKPYLKPCPVRASQWREYFKSVTDKPLVGIAWTGGVRLTGSAERSLPLDKLGPILDQDCCFIDMEYKDRSRSISVAGLDAKIHQYPWATLHEDYDNTVALLSVLDLLLCVPTTLTHAAGAIGLPCWCLVNARPNWRFGPANKEGRFLWHDSVELIRQKEPYVWEPVIEEVAKKLYENFHRDGQPSTGRGNGADVVDHAPPEQADRAGAAVS